MQTQKIGALGAVAGALVSLNALAFSLADVTFWVGSGANEAALVIDWNDGKSPQSLAWGYRWDGAATGLDMLQAVTAADSRFGDVVLTEWSFGWTVDGMGYDLNGNGFSQSDAGDHYKPGWVAPNYWVYWTYDGSDSPYGTGAFASSMVGLSGRTLSDGAWDGLRYDDGAIAPSTPVAASVIPEPGSFGLIVLAAGLVWRRGRRR